MRVDWDAEKGPHINVRDSRPGKQSQEECVAIPFDGDEETVRAIIESLEK